MNIQASRNSLETSFPDIGISSGKVKQFHSMHIAIVEKLANILSKPIRMIIQRGNFGVFRSVRIVFYHMRTQYIKPAVPERLL